MEGVMLEIYAHPKASYAARTRYNAEVTMQRRQQRRAA
jgi:hypothetical protein